MKLAVAACLAALFVPVCCFSQTTTQTQKSDKSEKSEPIQPDRPDFTNGPDTLEPGRLQLETGYTFFRTGTAKGNQFGEALLRYGLRDKLELNVSPNSYAWVRDPAGNASGFQDPYVGFKLKLKEGSEAYDMNRPSIGILVGTTLPIGSSSMGERRWQPQITLAAGWNLSRRMEFQSNVKYTWASEGGSPFSQWAWSGSLGYSICPKVGAFLEYFTLLPSGHAGPNASYVDGGFTYLVHNDLQLDIHAGFGMNGASPDYFIGVGGSVRW